MEQENLMSIGKEWPPWPRSVFFADFHIHSKYSRATSMDMTPQGLAEVAHKKGLKVIGTGDFTHPGYLRDLKDQLMPAESGLYVLKSWPDGPRFILTAEVANIYTQNNKGRRIHTLLFAPSIETAQGIQSRLKEVGNISSDGRPIFGFSASDLVRLVMAEDPECFVVPAHIWTPWFSLFGAKSGFDSIEECFGQETEHIHALETGLSSDQQMNWRLSALDSYTLISNSDAHSPWKLAREANVFSCELDYPHLIQAMKSPEEGFMGTVEFFPEEGKYHFDGHRGCNICFSPAETRTHQGICPVCNRPLTIGVLNRVDQLADRPEGFLPDCALPSVHLVPLEEIIAEAFGVKSITARVRREYLKLVEMAGPELELLLWAPEDDLRQMLPDKVAQGIMNMRQERIDLVPGHDGVYGRIRTITGNTGIVYRQREQTDNAMADLCSSSCKSSDKQRVPRQLSLFPSGREGDHGE